MSADVVLAMREVVVSESCGQLSVRLKTAGLMPSAACIREIMR